MTELRRPQRGSLFLAKLVAHLACLPERVIISALKRTGDQWQPLKRPNKGGGPAPTPRWMPATGLWMTAPMTLTAQFAANGTVPDLSDPARLNGWRELEIANHRLFYSGA
jgi:hypothetical protein